MKNKEVMDLEELQAIKALEQKLKQEDFSIYSRKDAVRNKVLKNIRENEVNSMKKMKSFRKPAVAVASIALGITLFAQTAVAKEWTAKIKEVFSVGNGNIKIMLLEVEEGPDSVPVPAELKGKLFDAKGNELTEFKGSKKTEMYTKEGEKIAYLTKEDGNLKIMTEAMEAEEKEKNMLVLKDAGKRNDYTAFDVKLPTYLPEGYQFDRIELYKDEKGTVENSKYIDVYYTNESTSNYIFMQQRLSDEETGYETGTGGTVEEAKVNETEALIMDSDSIHWEVNGVLYHINSRGGFSKEELLKVAESIK